MGESGEGVRGCDTHIAVQVTGGDAEPRRQQREGGGVAVRVGEIHPQPLVPRASPFEVVVVGIVSPPGAEERVEVTGRGQVARGGAAVGRPGPQPRRHRPRPRCRHQHRRRHWHGHRPPATPTPSHHGGRVCTIKQSESATTVLLYSIVKTF